MELPNPNQTSTPMAPPAQIYLRFRDGHQVTKTIPIHLPFVFGRDFLRIYGIDDNEISPRHAIIEKRPFGYALRDLRSVTGTFVNGNRAFDVQLLDRDRIRIGKVELTFISNNDMKLRQFYQMSANNGWQEQLDRLPALAKSKHPVLITGPSGTGKELLAQLIHHYSPRARGPFLSINCSALAENLTESELFGHTKGSFTGAQESRPGAFETAHGGTLAATNQDLHQLIASGRFRKDLYYRLHILQFEIPSLVQRMEDFDNILHFYSSPHDIRYTQDAVNFLKTHHWPGNIRELKNAVARAGAMYPNQPIGVHEVQNLIDNEPENSSEIHSSPAKNHSPRRKFLEIERRAIVEKLIHFNGNQRQAAIALGMPRSTLNDRLRRYNISVHEVVESKNTMV
jgi:DNA-binding NtrC family response regulator